MNFNKREIPFFVEIMIRNKIHKFTGRIICWKHNLNRCEPQKLKWWKCLRQNELELYPWNNSKKEWGWFLPFPFHLLFKKHSFQMGWGRQKVFWIGQDTEVAEMKAILKVHNYNSLSLYFIVRGNCKRLGHIIIESRNKCKRTRGISKKIFFTKI